ncbi:MAG: copper resistance protein B [Pseudohongiellaceae bacterium]
MSTLQLFATASTIKLPLLLTAILAGTAVAQDHEILGQPDSSDNHQVHAGHDNGTMPQDMTMLAQPAGERDPHAYSGGYTRSSGPYSLPPSQQLHLADESKFVGLWVDRLETRNGDAENFQEFAGYAWLGNSYERWILQSELEWRDQTVEESKTELLYSRAFAPFWNLEVGGRYDHGDKEHREWLALGVSGLAPYWFEVSATAYFNPEGHSAATVEAEYDLYLTQRLVLQPRAEADFYGDSDIEAGHGKGLSKSKMGFRLRYDFDRQFAPYIGYERVHRHGETIDVFEPLGQHREEQWIAGLRFWF